MFRDVLVDVPGRPPPGIEAPVERRAWTISSARQSEYLDQKHHFLACFFPCPTCGTITVTVRPVPHPPGPQRPTRRDTQGQPLARVRRAGLVNEASSNRSEARRRSNGHPGDAYDDVFRMTMRI